MPLVSNPLSPSSNFRVEVGKIPPSADLFPYQRVAARIAVRLSATLYKRLIETKKGLASMKGRVDCRRNHDSEKRMENSKTMVNFPKIQIFIYV